jgi:3-hydroxymyristoyl/3-hydroxydecanoyl-(acyl carrier protein) dehydratase
MSTKGPASISLPLDRVTLRTESASAILPRAAAQLLCEGHFPRRAIVPGAYLLGCMVDLAGTWLAHREGQSRFPTRVGRCVFHHPVFPDQEIVVSTSLAGDSPTDLLVRAEILVSGRRMARALLHYGAPGCS